MSFWYDPVGAASAVGTWIWNSQATKYVMVGGSVYVAVKYGPAAIKAAQEYSLNKSQKKLIETQITQEESGFLDDCFDIAHSRQIVSIEESLVKNGCYVHRREELAIFQMLDQALFGIEPFGIIIYGPKGVGKTHTLNRILYHFAGKKPNGKFDDIYLTCDENDREQKGYNEDIARIKEYFDKKPSYSLHVIFVNCNLAQARSSNDIKKIIENAIIKETDKSQFAGTMTFEQVLAMNVTKANKVGQKVLIYCRVTNVNDSVAFGRLVSCARELAEKDGIAVLMEISKPYVFSNNEANRMRVRKVQVSPLSRYLTMKMVTQLYQPEKEKRDMLDRLPDSNAAYAKTGGLPQYIFWEITGKLDVEILQRKEELREALVARGNAASEAQQLYGLLNGAVVNASDAPTQSLIDLGAVEECHVGKVSMADPIVKQAVLLLREEGFDVNQKQ